MCYTPKHSYDFFIQTDFLAHSLWLPLRSWFKTSDKRTDLTETRESNYLLEDLLEVGVENRSLSLSGVGANTGSGIPVWNIPPTQVYLVKYSKLAEYYVPSRIF